MKEIGYQRVEVGDLVIHSMDGFAGAIGVSDSNGKASPVVHAYEPIGSSDPHYYAYLLRVFSASGYITALAKGIRERSTAFDAETFRSLVLPEPAAAEQRAIADFLDAKTAWIDTLLAKKRRMISLLDDRFRGEVEARTGDGMPCRVRFLTSLVTSGPRGWSDRAGDTGQPFIRSANLDRTSIDLNLSELVRVKSDDAAEAARSCLQVGDVVVGITGANTGWVGRVGSESSGGYISQHVALLRPNGVEPEWLAYSIFSPRAQSLLLESQYGGTKQQLGLVDLADLVIGVPSPEARAAHLEALAVLRAQTTRARSLLSCQVSLLEEHRQALITAAVTGQIEVPGVAA